MRAHLAPQELTIALGHDLANVFPIDADQVLLRCFVDLVKERFPPQRGCAIVLFADGFPNDSVERSP